MDETPQFRPAGPCAGVTNDSCFTENLLSNCFVRRLRGAAGVEIAVTKPAARLQAAARQRAPPACARELRVPVCPIVWSKKAAESPSVMRGSQPGVQLK